MFKHLQEALENDDLNDFDDCIASTLRARVQALTILNDLYQKQRNVLGKRNSHEAPEPKSRMRTIPEYSPSASAAPDPLLTEQSFKLFSRFHKARRGTNQSLGTESCSGSIPSPESKDRGFFAPRRTRSEQPARETVAYLSTPTTRAAVPSKDSDSASQRSSVTSSSRSHSTVPPQDPGNLCEGAYYVQAATEIRGFELSKDGKRRYWKCRRMKCGFEGMARMNAHKEYEYDGTPRQHGPLRYHWLFLAKSHVVQSKKDYKRKFRCLVCRLEGREQIKVFEGDHALLTHVHKEHAGSYCTGVCLQGPVCFRHDRILVGDERDFDICFPNLEPGRVVEPPAELLTFSRQSTAVELEDAPREETPPGLYNISAEYNPWTTATDVR